MAAATHSADSDKAVNTQLKDHDKTMTSVGPVADKAAGGEPTTSNVLKERAKIFATKGSRLPELINFSALTWHDNVRPEEDMNLPAMVHSLKESGYLSNHPIVVSTRGKKFLVLQGNRRTEGLKLIQKEEPEIFKAVLEGGKIPAIILHGLTEAEEAIIRLDHGKREDRVGLSQEGIFLSVLQAMKAGYSTQADIAALLDLYIEDANQPGVQVPNRSYIQPRVTLARLPKFVQEEFIKLMKDDPKNPTKVRWGQVPKLYKLYTPGRNQGMLDGDAEFKEYWQSCLTGTERKQKQDKQPAGSVMSKAQLTDVGATFGSRLGQLIFLKVAGNTPKDTDGKELGWSDLDAQLVKAEASLQLQKDLREYFGPKEYDKAVAEIMKKRQAEAKAAKEAAKDAASE